MLLSPFTATAYTNNRQIKNDNIIRAKGIPFKGQVLNQIASTFLDATADIVPNWKLATPDPRGSGCSSLFVAGFSSALAAITCSTARNTILAYCFVAAFTCKAMAHLLERGGFRLEDKVKMYIPEFQPWVDPETGEKVDIRIIDLLTHSSGLPSYANTNELLKRYGVGHPDTLMSYINTVPRLFRPTARYEYSCLGFITLQNILQRITGKSISEYAKENIFDVLGMKHTVYAPKTKNNKEVMALVAPTVKQPDGSVLLGEAQDPLGRVMNWENSGNSGLFSSAEDLALLAAALMNGGKINGVSVLGKHTVEVMTRVPAGFEHIGRSLGWENYAMPGKYGCMFHSTLTFAHTGHTGTSILVDPVSKVGVILLAHRVHPADVGTVGRLRALVCNAVGGAIIE